LIVTTQLCDSTLRYKSSGQTLSDHKWIVAESSKDFAQHIGPLGLLRHAIQLSL
jgi:hypothetical protein